MLSNTDHLHMDFLQKKFPIVNSFRNKILSYKVGYSKPELEIYEFMIDKYNLEPGECFFIDDIEENITEAGKFGITTHLYSNHSNLLKEFKLITHH